MKVQIALTVNESKRMISKAVLYLPEINNALEKGKILLKGGTTVSSIAEELMGIPLYEKLIIEKDAVEILAKLNCTVIGKGGILGAEGSTVMVVEGLDKEVKKILKVIKEVKGADISGQKESLEECKRGNLSCKNHLACIYLGGV